MQMMWWTVYARIVEVCRVTRDFYANVGQFVDSNFLIVTAHCSGLFGLSLSAVQTVL